MEQQEKPNPASAPSRAPVQRKRIPMSLPHPKLAVPEMEGFYLYWFLGEARCRQALQAGYSFVEQDEVDLATTGLANSEGEQGSTDLGSRISVSGGSDGNRHYLMKLPSHLRAEDEGEYARNQERIAAGIRGDRGFIAPGQDQSNRYGGDSNRNIFLPKGKG